MIGAIANGRTAAGGVLDCDDCNYTMKAFKQMGIAIARQGDVTIIEGKGLKGLTKPGQAVNVGNSGTTMRLLAGILGGQDFETILTGDSSLNGRPMKRIVEPLSQMGVDIKAASGEYPPLKIIGGRLKPISYSMPMSSAQVKSAILLAGLYTDGVTTVREPFQSRDHTERMLRYFGAELKTKDTEISIKSGNLTGKTFNIPGDVSSASFFMVAATLLKGSGIKITGLGVNPTRTGILEVISRMGGNIKVVKRSEQFEPVADIEIESAKTKGVVIDESIVPNIIDELPIIFVLASLSDGRSVIRGAGELKVKETDRIRSMTENLVRMGAKIHHEKGAIIIDGVAQLDGADLKSYGDHRTCMSMAVAALTAKSESIIDDAACVSKSFPQFFTILDKMRS